MYHRSNSKFSRTELGEIRRELPSSASPQEEVLEQLCRLHWPAVFAYARNSGYSPAESEDLAQGFFTALFSNHLLSRYNPRRGNLRSFLLASFRNYLIDHYRRGAAEKRGGQAVGISLDSHEGYDVLHPGEETPDLQLDRELIERLLENSRRSLEERYRSEGKAELFQAIRSFLKSPARQEDYERVAGSLDTTPGAIRNAIWRLRSRFRDHFFETLETQSTGDEDLSRELDYLLSLIEG
jgi:RNA polymerase sigma factor (sigma-70 family)